MPIKIMLDAGHYGKYNAGSVKGYYESDMTWELHKLLRAELESYGFEIGVTRADKDKDLEEYARGCMAKGYDLFISLHSNAVDSEATKRVVVIPSVNGKSDELAQKLANTVLITMDLTKDKYWYTQIYKREYPNKTGVDYYGVLRGAVSVGADAIIIEHGFHTNREVCKWLMDTENLKKLAKAEAETIATHYGYKKKPRTIHRVQVGAYSDRKNAEATLEKLKKAGFDGFIATAQI